MKTWEDIKTFDDIILEEDRKIIKNLKNEAGMKCRNLKKIGNFFYYCAHGLGGIKYYKPSPVSPIYKRHVGVAQLQLYCMSDWNKNCDIKLRGKND